MHVMKGTKAAEDIIYQKIEEYRQNIEELQLNIYKTAELNVKFKCKVGTRLNR